MDSKNTSKYIIASNKIDALKQKAGSYVIKDVGGQIYDKTAKELRNDGYKIKCINLDEPEKSMKYNPLAYIHKESDVYLFLDAFLPNDNSDSSLWINAERYLIGAMVSYLCLNSSFQDKTMENMIKIINMNFPSQDNTDNRTEFEKIIDEVKNEDANALCVKMYHAFNTGAGPSIKAALVSISARLNIFNLNEIKEITSEDEIELDKLSDEKTALFIITESGDTPFADFEKFICRQAIAELYKKEKRKYPIFIIPSSI